MKPATCPTCKERPQLEEMEQRSVLFRGCTQCFGLFVSETGLGEYVTAAAGDDGVRQGYDDLLGEATLALAGTSKRHCPECDGPMRRMGFGESPLVILERCEAHGIWLDKKELTKVLRASRAHAVVKGWAGEEEGEPGS